MRKNFGPKPMIFPMPVLIIGTYNPDGTVNAMNAAWGGMADTDMVSICLDSHRTTENILQRKAFTVAMADVANVLPADYVGIVSGYQVPDKVAYCGWHTTRSEFVDAPLIGELPLALECELVSYDEETGLLRRDVGQHMLQHHVPVQGLLRRGQELPLLPREVHGHILQCQRSL